MDIKQATQGYEPWLASRATLIPADLELKHQRMAESPFPFLRATFYRWVQRWPEVCPDLATAPAVLSVGSFQAGSKHNVIPPEARLKITVRAYREEVRQALLEGIRRVVAAEAMAAGAPVPPDVAIVESTPGVVNDVPLTGRLHGAFSAALGGPNVVDFPPSSVSEDFAYYGREGVPASMFWLGAAPPSALAEAKAAGKALPPLHSAEFAPDYAPSIRTGVTALVAVALELLPAR